MKKCYIQNLALNITDNCNLECRHCLRGDRCNNKMSDDVIEATLRHLVRLKEQEIFLLMVENLL